MSNSELYKIAKQMMHPGKGILASDESTNSANKTLSKNGIEPIEENRRKYRELFIGTPGIKKYINGIILFEETLKQRDSNDKPFRDILKEAGILIGIKVDTGMINLPGFPGEKVTTGLSKLPERLEEYYDLGARFAKWRATTKIGGGLPSDEAIFANSHALAIYASVCQSKGIVPIVEPEVLIDGDHTLEESFEVTEKVLKTLFYQMERMKVDLKGIILKASMVHPGKENRGDDSNEKIAQATVECLLKSVPKEVPGIVFLSGGQSPEEVNGHLSAIVNKGPHPWEISFSFLRAIEGPATEIWAGKDENIKKARVIFEQDLQDAVSAEHGEYK